MVAQTYLDVYLEESETLANAESITHHNCGNENSAEPAISA